MGKSSLLQRTSQRLEQEDYSCVYIDVTRLGSEETTPKQWYKGIIISLFYQLNLAKQVNFKDWWDEVAELSFVQRLHQFVEQVLLSKVQSERILIFIDEIDSLLSLRFPVNDFFAWIRHCYNQRTQNSDFARLGFAIFGVASPSDLIADKLRTPFNIGRAISLSGFQLQEATPLLAGLEGVVSQSAVVLQEIIHWTGGQPFLTQKLCQLVRQTASETARGRISLPPGTEGFWVERLVRSRLIQHWESQDEPEHLRTIRNRLLFSEQRAGRLLGLYQRVLQAAENKFHPSSPLVPIDDSREQTELLLSGLVEKRDGYLRIKNPIYSNVFNAQWVVKQLDALRPYSQLLNAWVASGYRDESRLLRGIALGEVLDWTQDKSLSNLDYKFLAASQELERREIQQKLEAERLKEVESRLALERKIARRQRQFLVGVSLALVAAIALGITSFYAYQQAALSEVRALASASNGSFNSHQHLDALVQAIEARTKFQKLNLLDAADKTALDPQTHSVLEQTVYGADEVNRLSGHQGGVLGVDFSPDGKWIATSGTDRTVRLWQRDGTLVRTLLHDVAVWNVVFSPDSQRIAASELNGVVRLWRVDGTPLVKLKGHTATVWGTAFSPDGKTIASASADRTIKLWRSDGTLIKTLEGHQAAAWRLDFSPNGKILVSCSQDGTIKLWRSDGKLIRTLQDSEAAVWSVAFSPDGQTLVSGGADKRVKLWSREGKLLKTLEGHTAEVLQVAFSHDGQMLASASADKTVKLWRRDGNLLRTFQGHRAPIRSVAFSPDGLVASASEDGMVKLWKISPFLHPLNGYGDIVWRVVYAPDRRVKKFLLATIAGQEIKLWQSDGSLVKTIRISTSQLYSAAFSPNGQFLAVAGDSGGIVLLNLANDKTAILRGHNALVMGLAYSPNGQSLVSAGDDLILKLWQRNVSGQFQLRQTIKAHSARIWDVAFSRDGQFVASVSIDGTVKLWTWKDAEHLVEQPHKILKGHTSAIWGVAFSPDNQHIISAGRDGQLLLWNREGALVRAFKGGGNGLTRVAFSPDGQKIAAGTLDNTVKIWALDGRLLATLSGHTSGVVSVAFSPDGKTLTSGSYDQTAIWWDLEQIVHLDLLKYGCDWARDYLKTNTEGQKGDFCGKLH
jgi:WD40 repeat protein